MAGCDPRGRGLRRAARSWARGRRGSGRRPQVERLKVALDTNVLVSAAISDGPPRRLLELAAEGSFELLVPDLVLAELKRVLVEKLQVEPPVLEHLIALLDEIPFVHLPTPRSAEARSGDPSDDRILAAAIAGGADLLVSGDRRHLLPLREVEGMPIVRPQDLLARVAG